MGGDGVLNQEWDLYLFSICFSLPSSPWSFASDAIWGGGRSSPIMSFIFKKKEWECVRMGFNFRNKAFTLPCPPCLWRQAPVDTRSWPLCSCIVSESSLMTPSPWWLEPHLCCPFQLGLWADPFLWIGVCSAAPTQNGKLLWFLLWFLLWWYVPNDLLNAVC